MSDPTFLIAGGQRCGTTSLWHLLDSHPQVYLAKPVRPEPKFFVGPPSAEMDRAWYISRYFAQTGDARAIGEKSTTYLESPDAPQRIAAMFPHMRLIFLLRHPVERAISNYRFSRSHGFESLPFEEAIRSEERRIAESSFPGLSGHPLAYLHRGIYADFLQRYAEHFPWPQIKVVLSDDLFREPAAVCRDLYGFLGVDADFVPHTLTQRHNAHAQDDLSLSSATIDYMLDFFRDPNRRLAEMLRRELNIWDRPSKSVQTLIR